MHIRGDNVYVPPAIGVGLTVKLVFNRTLGKMQECYQVVFPGQAPVIKKGHIEPIDISVASRGSNKKVTTFAAVLKQL